MAASCVREEEASVCTRLSEVTTAARAVVAALDGASLTGSELGYALRDLMELERIATAGKLLLAPRLASSDAWARDGHRSPEEWMARTAGTSVGQAKQTMETARKIEALPQTKSAVRAGELSLAQAAAVADAAAADPSTESKLLDAAGIDSLKTLQDKSRRVVLRARGSIEERYARQRRLRSLSWWTDDEGMTAGRFRLTPEAGAALVTKIRAEADRQFRQAHREGRAESSENHAADALLGLVTGEGLIGTKSGSKGSEVVVVVSRESLLRGAVDEEAGELCEVPGFGAVPVSVAREMLADCFLKGVLVDGKKIVTVKHFGRHRPAELDTALLVRSVLGHGQVICVVEGCGQTVRIQWDHAVPHGRGGPTAEWNLNPMCGFDNRQKESGRVAQTGDGRWVRTAVVAQTRNPP